MFTKTRIHWLLAVVLFVVAGLTATFTFTQSASADGDPDSYLFYDLNEDLVVNSADAAIAQNALDAGPGAQHYTHVGLACPETSVTDQTDIAAFLEIATGVHPFNRSCRANDIPGLEINNQPEYVSSVGITTTHEFSITLAGDIALPITVSFGLIQSLQANEFTNAPQGDTPPWRLWSDTEGCEAYSDTYTTCVIQPVSTKAPTDGRSHDFVFHTIGNSPGNIPAQIFVENSQGDELSQFTMAYVSEPSVGVNNLILTFPYPIVTGETKFYSVAALPNNATTPISFNWQFSKNDILLFETNNNSDDVFDTVQYNPIEEGWYVVKITANNGVGDLVVLQQPFYVSAEEHKSYLPLVTTP